MNKVLSATITMLVFIVGLASAFAPGCATTPDGPGPISVAKDCAITAGKDTASLAITEIESALAQPSMGSALAGLERLAGTYGIAFVSCVVDHVTSESTANLARSNGTDDLAAAKISNGRAWLTQHPVGQ